MNQKDFRSILDISVQTLNYIAKQPEGLTLRGFKRFVKLQLPSHGLDPAASVYYDQLVLDILEVCLAVKRIIVHAEPTRIVANNQEVQ